MRRLLQIQARKLSFGDMGFVGNQNPWGPYENFRDCSQEICSIYCPQFCSLILPPPPPFDEDSGTPLSPLIIAAIGVLASAFVLVSCYAITTRFCRRRRNGRSPRMGNQEEAGAESGRNQRPVVAAGLDESVIKTITVCKYQKGDGLIEGADCAVCLSEFQENESLRLLPNCSHAFHLPCIDTWLKSQSNCPLCRANVDALCNQTHPPVDTIQSSSTLNANSYEIRRPDDLILVVDDQERECQQEMVISLGDGASDDRRGNDVNGVEQVRSSACLGPFSPPRRPLISDILKFEEINEYVQVQSDHLWRGIGSSKGFSLDESNRLSLNRNRECGLLLPSPIATKRTVSTSRFMLSVHDKGEHSLEYR